MDENAVINAVCSRLEREGCTVTQRLLTTEQGVDVIASNSGNQQQYFIEAKGGTSSRPNSPRFGRLYTQSQVFDRAAKGIFTCLQLRAKHPNRETEHVILAVPNSRWFEHYLLPLVPQLEQAGVIVWFEASQ